MKQKSLKKNVIMNVILSLSNVLFPLLTYGYVSRILTPTGIGKVAFVSSIISYFSYIATLGIPVYGLREAAKIKNNKDELSKLVHELLVLNIISSLISYCILFGCVVFIPKFNDYKILFATMSASIMLNTIGVEWLYKALEEYSYITVRSLIFKVIYVPLVFLLINSKNDYIIYGFLTIFVSSANYICNFINIRKYINFKKYKDYNFTSHLKPIFILFSATIIISIYSNFDITMLGFYKSEYDIGLYNVAIKIKTIMQSISTGVATVFIPRISYYIGEKKYKDVKEIILKYTKISLLLLFPIIIFILLDSKNILIFLCGQEFAEACNSLRVLMICEFCMIFTNLFGSQLLIPLGKEKKYTLSVFIGLIINICLNMILIPKYGTVGAAIGTAFTELWNMIYMGYCIKEYAIFLIKNIKIYKYIIGIFVSLLLTICFQSIPYCYPLILHLIADSFIFFLSYYVLLLIAKESIISEAIKKVFSHK